MKANVPYDGVYCDERMGGAPKSYLGCKPANADMRIPDEYLDGVVFLCVESPDEADVYQYFGTGFFVSLPTSWPSYHIVCLVTAKHVVKAAKDAGYDRLYVRMNIEGGSSIIHQLRDDGWLYSDNPAVDVAVLPIPMVDGLKHKSIPIENFGGAEIIKKESIGIGDEIFAIGLFTRRTGKHKNTPILRTGVIAAMPDEPFETDEGEHKSFLVELRSIGGISGCPVFVDLGFWRLGPDTFQSKVELGGFTIRRRMHLIGMIRSHWNLEKEAIAPADFLTADENKEIESLNTGIAVVTPIDEVLAILTSDAMMKVCAEAEKKARELYSPEPSYDLPIKPNKSRKSAPKK